MGSPQKPGPKSSRWGFLQQAVASVESRLDNILADEEDPAKKTVPRPGSKDGTQSSRASAELSRASSGHQTNDRLQERLARAMAKKNISRPDSPFPESEPQSRAFTPSNEGKHEVEEGPDVVPDNADSTIKRVLGDDTTEENTQEVIAGEEHTEPVQSPQTPANASPVVLSTRTSVEARQDTAHSVNGGMSSMSASPRPSRDLGESNDASEIRSQAQATLENKEYQEEISICMERIDALQMKLQYLTKEAATSARDAAAAAESGSPEKKLLEKDEKIALLMQEGQKLSKSEMMHLSSIKKLREQAATQKKEQTELRLRAEAAQKSLLAAEDRARRAEAAVKRAEENLSSSINAARDFDAINKERNALTNTVSDIRAQLSRANARADAAETKAQSDFSEKEKKRVEALEEQITSARLERETNEERLKREISDLKASLDHEKTNSRAMETEMLAEQAALESKLESFRARAEEASSNSQGDTQAKLLRQIETLQSQYAVAGQNWQGIEGSLQSRIGTLERERDDAIGREGELRKKLREVTIRAKKNDNELESSRERYAELERLHAEIDSELQRMVIKGQQSEQALLRAKRDLEDQISLAEKDFSRRLEEERLKWAASIPRNGSPGASIRKGSHYDIGHLMSPTFERPQSQRANFSYGADFYTPPRQHSIASSKPVGNENGNGNVVEAPSRMTTIDPDDDFSQIPLTSASQENSQRGIQDLISNSTVGAGPSVQLVERMSANIRRLESEKAASKDELSRLTTQRDEARKEVVSSMKEIEEKRAVEERLQKLEEVHKSLTERYQTTLEMLGEKSELVEELKADVADVKQMYRELVDTMK